MTCTRKIFGILSCLSNEKFKDPTRSNIASAQCQQSRPDLVSEAFETSSKVFRTDVSMKNSVNDVAIKNA